MKPGETGLKSLKERVAVVVGNATPATYSVVKALVDSGTCVAMFDIGDAGDELSELATISQSRCMVLSISDDHALHHAVSEVVRRFGGIDLLINMGYSRARRGPRAPRGDWLGAMDVNVVGALMLAHAVCPEIKERGGGSIVNVVSADRTLSQAGRTSNVASDVALRHLSRSMAADFERDNIRVNSVSFRSNASDDDTARVVLFLCADAARKLSGVDFVIDSHNFEVNHEVQSHCNLIQALVSD